MSSWAVDVVVFRSAGGGSLHSTDFCIKFETSSAKRAAQAVLGMNEGASLLQGSETFVSASSLSGAAAGVLGVGRSSGATVSPNLSTDDLSLQAADSLASSFPSSTFSTAPEPAWVDLFCNGKHAEELAAYVDLPTETVFFKPFANAELPVAAPSPSDVQLQRLSLRPGKNQMVARHRRSGQEATFDIWLFSAQDRLLIMDIDGTITRSDVRGYFESVYLGVFSYVHDGVAPLLHAVREELGLHVLYLTSRPVAHQRETRQLLLGVRDRGLSLPEGPLFVNKESTSGALYRELIAKNTRALKVDILLHVRRAFAAAVSAGPGAGAGAGRGMGSSRPIDTDADFASPFAWGIGNKPADCQAYALAGVSKERILLIDTSSTLRVWAEAEAGTKQGAGAGAGSGSGAKSSDDLGAPGGREEGGLGAARPTQSQSSLLTLPQTRSQTSVHELAALQLQQQQHQAGAAPLKQPSQGQQGQQGQGVGRAGSFAGYRDPSLLRYLGVAPHPHAQGGEVAIELSATSVVRPLEFAMDDRI